MSGYRRRLPDLIDPGNTEISRTSEPNSFAGQVAQNAQPVSVTANGPGQDTGARLLPRDAD